MFTKINIERLLRAAEDAEAVAHDERERLKQGILRGGNSGVVVDSGLIYGSCPRASLARYLGFDSPVDDRSTYFFSAGHLNEVRWQELLQSTPGSDQVWLRESEVPTRWTARTPAGVEVPVTGSPDVVLVTKHADYVPPKYDDQGTVIEPARNYTPDLLLELKKVCSTYRAVQAFIKFAPDAAHLAQAAHYSWQLGMIPGVLSYTSDSSYDTPYWAIKKFNLDRKIQPGREHFYFGWQDGLFCFVHPQTAQVVRTQITVASIERYYTLVLGMRELKQLGPRPEFEGLYPGHDEYDKCKNCAFAEACDQYDRDQNYDNWVDQVSVISKEGSDE